ncbi:helix-turn-helix domain-containing protein [Nonomuraea sp. NPDC059194]|uniref:helix-turn-helix domain-containing protein n=1 Tax=Nonomuraea sp. NPDC059194 TaxID=3346764 RepID=UPI0036A46EF0
MRSWHGRRAEQIIERGVLSAPVETSDVAGRQAEVIGRLAAEPRVGLAAADPAAAELGISRRQVYVLLRRWRQGEGVVSDLLPRRSRRRPRSRRCWRRFAASGPAAEVGDSGLAGGRAPVPMPS